MSGIEDRCRMAISRLSAVLAAEIRSRVWAAEDAERDSWDLTENLERIDRPARWPPIRQRLEEAREPEELLRTVEQVAREFAQSWDDDGFAILTYQVPQYLSRARRWPPGRVGSVEAAIEAEERHRWSDTPEGLFRELERLRQEADEANREAREAVS